MGYNDDMKDYEAKKAKLRNMVEAGKEILPEKDEDVKCFFCGKRAKYFDKVRKVGVVKIVRKIPNENGIFQTKEINVCDEHYEIEVKKPIV